VAVHCARRLALNTPAAAEWRADVVVAPGRVTALETNGLDVRIAVGRSWYRVATDPLRLEPATAPERPAMPADALPDGRVAIGGGTVARAWLAEPTTRYRHGVLGMRAKPAAWRSSAATARASSCGSGATRISSRASLRSTGAR
jgi:hypothetical protein